MSSISSQLIATKNEFNQALSTQKGSELDKESFLLLLVTQFQNQDPLNPMEDKEFVAQLAQYSSLEQLMNLNTGMATLTEASAQSQMINATSYIGKSVDAAGKSISKVTEGDISTISTYRYAIGETSVGGTVFVYDANSQLVNSYTLGAQQAGTYDFAWDGQSYAGPAPDGVYNVVVNCKNAAGDTLQYDAVVSGRVAGITQQDNETLLTLSDGRTISLAGVRRVTEPVTVSNASSQNGTGSNTGSDTGSDTTNG